MKGFSWGLALSAVMVCLSFQAQAAEGKKAAKAQKQSVHDQVTGQGYGTAGCGLGSIAFGPKPGMIQIVAATLNGTGGSQTFGISTGTSNCDIPENGMQAAVFIEVNKEIVMKDAARGEGETMKALAGLLECQSESVFAADMKSNYGFYFEKASDTYEVVRRIMTNAHCGKG